VRNIPSLTGPAARIERALASGRLPPTWLLHGPEATGKWALAMELAQALLCERPDPWSCAECRACRKFAGSNHTDMFLLFALPTGGGSGKARDKFQSEFVSSFLEFKREAPLLPYAESRNRFIPAERVSELIAWASLTPREGARKVAIVYEPELIVRSITDKLLKLTEEPPADTTLILVSHRPEGIPDTIRSRARQIPVPRMGPKGMAEYLAQSGHPRAAAAVAARRARGAVGRALAELAEVVEGDVQADSLGLLASLLDEKPAALTELQLMHWKAQRQRAQDILDVWATLVRDITCEQYSPALLAIGPVPDRTRLTGLAHPDRAWQALDLIRETQAALATNVHIGTALLALAGRLGRLGQGKALAPTFWPAPRRL